MSDIDRHWPAWKPLLDAKRSEVLQISGVISVGIGGRPGKERVVVLVHARTPDLVRRIEAVLKGLDIKVDQSSLLHFL